MWTAEGATRARMGGGKRMWKTAVLAAEFSTHARVRQRQWVPTLEYNRPGERAFPARYRRSTANRCSRARSSLDRVRGDFPGTAVSPAASRTPPEPRGGGVKKKYKRWGCRDMRSTGGQWGGERVAER